MIPITQKDLQSAFQRQRRGRNYLLFIYHKSLFEDRGLAASFLSEKFTTELDSPISVRVIYNIRQRYLNKALPASLVPRVQAPEVSTAIVSPTRFEDTSFRSSGEKALDEAMERFNQ